MRVLHFREAFSSLSETFIYDLVCQLEANGLDNYVMTFERENAETRPFSKVLQIKRAHKHHLLTLVFQCLSVLGFLRKNDAKWRVNRARMEKAIRQLQPDVLHVQFGPAAVYIAPVAEELNIPLIVTFHGYDVTLLAKDPFWREQYNRLWPRIAICSGVSNYICKRVLSLGAPKDRLVCVSNGVRITDLSFTPPTERFTGQTVECLFVGRLVEKKGPVLLLQSFAKACKIAPETRLRLHIVGDGPLAHEVRSTISNLGIQELVTLHGSLPHSAVKELMSQVHIYLQHSLTASNGDEEGQPVSLIEATAAGLPVISTRHSGIPEIILDGHSGLLVDEGDTEGMASQIAFLSQNPNLWSKMGALGREHAEQNMDLIHVAKIWQNLYESVLHLAKKSCSIT